MRPPFPEFQEQENNIQQSPVKMKKDSSQTQFSEEIVHISRLRDVPLRMLIPNLITLGAICSGLTSIRLAWEGRFELAIISILFSAILDGIDGRVARLLKAETSFGKQMDSLADFVNFGVAPAIIIYLWTLHEVKSLGWVIALIFAICVCLRLARFNVLLSNPEKEEWEINFFTGVPAPASATLALLPLYLSQLGLELGSISTGLSAIYLFAVAFLTISNIPTWSGKQIGQRVSRKLVLPIMLGVVLLAVLLFSYPWQMMSFICIAYLITIPLSIRDWNRHETGQASRSFQ
ncbi:CDP-diacylglycerol--serine O-phosphatidyltransferase [Candidatus Endowatersipora endosymbiont of Watersipora subatra]|uniref:CDP-diacylglycerol--serine O-phosphatidyltransferase n=1 Tax=Candidatus Endowatersipora endosymbiont of Watersipora subatra TaxID=3077946 RepID=UPI00312C7F19